MDDGRMVVDDPGMTPNSVRVALGGFILAVSILDHRQLEYIRPTRQKCRVMKVLFLASQVSLVWKRKVRTIPLVLILNEDHGRVQVLEDR
jgi:hypothetical protein